MNKCIWNTMGLCADPTSAQYQRMCTNNKRCFEKLFDDIEVIADEQVEINKMDLQIV